MIVPHRKYSYGPPHTFIGIALLFHMQMIFVAHMKYTYEPPQPLKVKALLYILGRLRKITETYFVPAKSAA
jgi:hypothetical protein